MSDTEILLKAIRKAGANGWHDANVAEEELRASPDWSIGPFVPFTMTVIYNHDFAKALWTAYEYAEYSKWGAGDNCKRCGDGSVVVCKEIAYSIANDERVPAEIREMFKNEAKGMFFLSDHYPDA